MRIIKSYITQILSWLLAAGIAFLIINTICFFYERPVGWIDTPNGVSDAVSRPYSIVVHGTEGYGVVRVDKNGFFNPDLELLDDYVLVMGASHTIGKEVRAGEKYSVILNDMISDDGKLHVLNIGCNGNYLPSIIKHFNTAVRKYPKATCVIMEVGSLDFAANVIDEAIEQGESDFSDADELFSQRSVKEKVYGLIKETSPFLSRVKNQIVTFKHNTAANQNKEDSDGGGATELDKEQDIREYANSIDEALKLIRNEYSGKLAFLYHIPGGVSLDKNERRIEKSDKERIFIEVCKVNDIDVIEMQPIFEDNYCRTGKLPYGFANSSPGNGHLNKVGHKIVAETLHDYLKRQ